MAEGTPIALPGVIVLEPLPLTQLATNHTQQVVTKSLAVFTRHHEGGEAIGLLPCQHLRMRFRLLAIALCLDICVVTQLRIVIVDLSQYGSIDSCQNGVFHQLELVFQSADGWSQRVWSHLGLQACMQQG